MNYKDIVCKQIKHNETEIVPYTLGFQQESRLRLDEYTDYPGYNAKYHIRIVKKTGERE